MSTNKYKLKIFLIIFLSFVCINKVSAIYNGSAGTAYSGGGKGQCGVIPNCEYNNDGKLIIQARLYYINNGSFEPIGSTYYFVNTNAYNYLKGKGLNLIKIDAFDSYTGTDKYQKVSNYLKNTYFGNNVQKATAKDFLNKVTGSENYKDVLTKESQPANKTNQAIKGYRIIIEVARNYANPTFNDESNALITAKGMARESTRLGGKYIKNGKTYYVPSCPGSPNQVTSPSICVNPLLGKSSAAQNLFTEFNDVGIFKGGQSYCEGVNINSLADMRNGCGFNIIDISQYTEEKCYEAYIESQNGDLTCKNYNENNVGKFYEKYNKLNSCNGKTETEKKQYNEYGKLIKSDGVCSIYCTEEAMASFPGNVSTPILKGSYFAWPTRSDDIKGIYKMSSSVTYKCKIIDFGGSGDTVSATMTRSCRSGYSEYDADHCIENKETAKVCPSGTVEIAGKCYKKTEPISKTDQQTQRKAPLNCPTSNSIEIGGYCYKKESGKQSNLIKPVVKDKICKKGVEVENRCKYLKSTIKTCPSGYTLNSTKTKCYKYNYSYSMTTAAICVSKKGEQVGYKNCNIAAIGPIHGGQICCRTSTTSYKNYIEKKVYDYVSKECPTGYPYEVNGKCQNIKSSYCSSGTYQSDIGKCVECTSEASVYHGNGICRSYNNTGTQCPSGYYKSGNECVKDEKYCLTGTYKEDINKCVVCPNGSVYYGNGICRLEKETKKECPNGTKEINGTCHKIIEKNQYNYSCPNGYTQDGTTCKKICNSLSLIESAKSSIRNLSFDVKLIAGTNKKIDENLNISKTEEFDDTNLTYTIIADYSIRNYINRYFNRITNQVFNQGPASITVFDRKEGVISTNINDLLIENNKVKNYPLELSNVNLGSGNKFGSKYIKKYQCTYNLIEEEDKCICPSGTKNEGDNVDSILEKICTDKNDQIFEKTCSEKQRILCNYDANKNYVNEICSGSYHCKNTSNNQNIDITNCVKSKTNLGITLENAILKCTREKEECTNNYCINIKTNEKIDISSCLKDGNSRTTCETKYGCLEKTCPSGNCCIGECNYSIEKLQNVILNIQKCNDKYCNLNLYCSDTTKKSSKSSKSCIKDKLSLSTENEIIEKLNNNSISIEQLRNAIFSCNKEICPSTQKIIYRVIDLNNPFVGLKNNNSLEGFSSTGIKSRKPGENWNSKTVVNEEILNARGANGYKIYNKEPILTITLTPEMIKKIRKYGKDYSDFNLKCNGNNNNSGCISYFIHSSSTTIGKQLEIGGVEACTKLNASSSIEDFNQCYNSNN